MIEDPIRFREALARFDAANREDPRIEVFEGQEYPKELLYAERMSAWLERIAPQASEAVRLAVRSQHICRWKIPRSEYPMDRPGYRRWRTDLGKAHSQTAGRILRDVGYDDETISRVQSLLRKERLKVDPDCQLLEDVICLVFLEHYAAEFSRKHDEDKLINIFRRTWKKMSTQAQEAALQMELPKAVRPIVEKALGT